MTETVKDRITKVLDDAKAQSEKTRKRLRRNRLAYIGLHGVAFDRAQENLAKFRSARTDLFNNFVEKGEEMEARARDFFEDTKEKIDETRETTSKTIWNLTPGSKVNRVEALEAELEAAKAKVAKLSKTAKKATKKKAKKAATVTMTATVEAVKTVSDAVEAVAETIEAETKVADTSETKTAEATSTPATKPAAKKEPRHIPYFNDVKRYDPLAKEDIVRKIVNHCGIALQSTDARYVACTDEAERNRVRDSWMKKKLGLTASDADLEKKIQNICAVMQRDNLKNRVTFYYLIAKAERKLEEL